MALTKVQKELVKPADSLNPTGAILMFAGSVAPTGWLLCDGTEYSKTLYPELSAVLSVGDTFPYGQTNGSGGAGTTHFRLPDFRAMFPRGAAMGAVGSIQVNSINYTPQSLGTRQGDAMQGHYHRTKVNINGGLNNSSFDYASNIPSPTGTADNIITGPISDGTNGTPRTTSETRPINLSVNFIIKY
jgi:microcystin-dependent protein